MFQLKLSTKVSKIYAEYCMACHGVNGDGKGVASKGIQPPSKKLHSWYY